MAGYVNQMEEDFMVKLEKVTEAWSDTLFSVVMSSKRLSEEKSDVFHSFTMKIMFLHKRGSPYVEAGVSFLSVRVSESADHDCKKKLGY